MLGVCFDGISRLDTLTRSVAAVQEHDDAPVQEVKVNGMVRS